MTEEQMNTVIEETPSDVPEVIYNDEEEAAKQKAMREAAIIEDSKLPFDPDALLEVRHLRKCFPIKKSMPNCNLLVFDICDFCLC